MAGQLCALICASPRVCVFTWVLPAFTVREYNNWQQADSGHCLKLFLKCMNFFNTFKLSHMEKSLKLPLLLRLSLRAILASPKMTITSCYLLTQRGITHKNKNHLLPSMFNFEQIAPSLRLFKVKPKLQPPHCCPRLTVSCARSSEHVWPVHQVFVRKNPKTSMQTNRHIPHGYLTKPSQSDSAPVTP